MAGEWIKVELSLPQKPEVIRIGRALGISPEAVCGWLIKFWGWIGSNSVDGSVTQVALRDVDMVVGLPGFADALVTVGWLRGHVDDTVIIVPNFDRHNGESAKKRALTARRQDKFRNKNSNAVVDAKVTLSELPEKRREEVIKPPEPDGSLDAIWKEGISILQASRMGEATARSFIGMLCKRHETNDVADAIQSAAGKADPKGYIQAILKTKPLKGALEARATFD